MLCEHNTIKTYNGIKNFKLLYIIGFNLKNYLSNLKRNFLIVERIIL